MARRKPPTHPSIVPPHIELHQLNFITEQSITLNDQAAYVSVKLQRCQVGNQAAEDVLFDQVIAEHTDFSQSCLVLAQFLDSQFHTCDFAITSLEKACMRRVQLIACRLPGVVFTQADMQDVVVQKCQGDMSHFWDCTLKATRFEHCTLRQASFASSTLAGVVFRHCDLTQADFRGANLRGADLRGSILDGLQVGVRELQGAIIDSGQAVQLVRVLGVLVRDEDETP
ncbi:MAG: pentapeptide repeat-containing protein [Chloroflexaceae bacterium]|nr:pentapeptide repeat-containing protein [Chloroflexaceae bacterium]